MQSVPYIPTSERLEEHFLRRLRMPVQQQKWHRPADQSEALGNTNCYSDYPGFVCNNEIEGYTAC
jgi:hypothetical protein